MHDRDSKFFQAFTAACKAGGLRTNPLPVASPNLNGRCERFNGHRAHLERGNLPPQGDVPDEVLKPIRDSIEVKSHVRGLVKSFERKAA